jgi:hypothetical protein
MSMDTGTAVDDEFLHLNGIDVNTGLPLAQPLSPREVTALARGGVAPRAGGTAGPGRLARAVRGLLDAVGRVFARGPYLGLPDDDEIVPTDPRSVGWAVAVAADAPPEAVVAADRLYEHRLRRTGVSADRCKRLAYPAGCPLPVWLRMNRAHAADVVPTRLPYYVALVGGPETIPFEVQTELGMHYAVGRIAFDEPAAYGRYVESLIDYETSSAVMASREVVYWGTRNRYDRATALSADYLVAPLFSGLPEFDGQPAERAIAGLRGFRSLGLLGAEATRGRLLEVLHGRDPSGVPSVLFTASHGLGWLKPHADQPARQGALLCQDWPGLGTPPRPGDYLAAADLADDARLHGLVAFLFACYGAGTPAFDEFSQGPSRGRAPIAERPFIAALPQRLLAHPGGGALAVLGHVERAWAYSIRPPRLGPSLLPFRNFLSRVMKGEPVGQAARDFGDRFTAASVRLLEAMTPGRPGDPLGETDLTTAWIERNDARNYVILGDPAARLRVDALR